MVFKSFESFVAAIQLFDRPVRVSYATKPGGTSSELTFEGLSHKEVMALITGLTATPPLSVVLPVPAAKVEIVSPPASSPHEASDAHVPADAALPADALDFPPKDAPAVPVETVSAPSASAHDSGELPDNVKKAGRMLDIVSWLMERGIKEVPAMVAECERVKPQVPFLSRVADMQKRIERTLAAYHG